ncbi:hypothetical protein Anapl_02033 [Anas platyrhynchos]|uniref:Uncharacterized protein n=1 Tax=Anas platyrhynchos TaxID=8839 RepID=R0LP66_ANAPL|nr:hypothetical protein Anapl_02033 [Anas platyrhynchos]
MEKLKAAELHWAQYLLASWRKAKEIWILNFYFFCFFSLPSAYSPGLCGFPGAELKAAVQKHMASIERRTDTALCLCQFGALLAPHCPASSSHPWETGDVLSPPVGCKAQRQNLSLPHVLVTSEASHSKKKGRALLAGNSTAKLSLMLENWKEDLNTLLATHPEGFAVLVSPGPLGPMHHGRDIAQSCSVCA